MKKIIILLLLSGISLYGASRNASVYERILNKAIVSGDLVKAKQMLAKGADINAEVYGSRNNGYFLEWVMATSVRHCGLPYKSLEFLYANGYDVSPAKDYVGTSFHDFARCKDGYKRVKLIFENSLHYFMNHKSDRGYAVKRFFNNRLVNNKEYMKSYEYVVKKLGKKALNEYYWQGSSRQVKVIYSVDSPEYLKVLVKNNLIELNESIYPVGKKGKRLHYPIDVAIKLGNLPLIKYMIKNGAKITQSALKVANYRKNDEIELFLIEHQE